MAETLVQVLKDNLISLTQNGITSYMGAEDDMNKLSSTLTTIQAVLEDAEDKQWESKPTRNWLRKIYDLVHEIEDVLDECATEASKLEQEHGKLNFRRYLKKILNRFQVESRMREVTDKLDAVAAEREKFHLVPWDKERQSSAATTTRETCSILDEPDHVVGRDEDKDKIVDILVNHVQDSEKLSALPIIGIGGLGKTTLAQLVFNDPLVTEHFEKKLWVCVSDNFDTKTLVKAMVESATGSRSDCDNLETLQRHLRKLLNHKRFLIILDDVWNDDQAKWYKLKSVLDCGSRGASIVVTTRLKKVADIMGTLPAHHLSGLSEEHCWLLFKQRAFAQETVEQHPNLESIGRQIVKKCSGVPLAAKALGGLLRFKSEEKEWLYVKESSIMSLPHDEALILPALRLSYQHLPLQLRQCFAYCAVFPKDHIIEKEELIFCWMAHGYISSNGIKEVEDVGNDIWNELVFRSLFQDVGMNYDKKTICKMHDLVHDLAQSIMENKVPGAEVESSDRHAFNQNKIRQVSVRKRYVAFPTSFQKEVNMSYTLKTFSRLRMLDASCNPLRMLDASLCDHVELPSKIGSLKHLRYLNMTNSNINTLPDTICSLWNLEILNLNNCRELVSLPKNMSNMKKLRHLFLERCLSLREMPPKIGELTYLKTLSIFIVGHEINNQLVQLQHLNLGGLLKLGHLERVKNHSDANISEKSNLRHLDLQWESGIASEQQQQEMDEKLVVALVPPSNLETLSIYGFRGRYFPPWARMEKVTEIQITDCPNCLRLPQLGDLPRLKRLYLKNLGSLEYLIEINQVKKDATILFPSLEYLKLSSLPNLKELFPPWLRMENVTEIEIKDCPNCLGLQHLGDLPRLKSLKLDNLHVLYVMEINQVKKDATILFPSLEKLTLSSLPKLKGLLLKDDEEGLQCLKTLNELKINGCDTLTCLRWLRHLTSLETLEITSCSELVEILPAEGMKSLNTLYIDDLPKLTSLPEELQHLSPSLQYLELTKLPQLTSLPDWLGNFTSLQHFDITDCPRLTSLPPTIKGMTNLKTLFISGEVNGELKRRCEKEKGEDWHLISHIPNVGIY